MPDFVERLGAELARVARPLEYSQQSRGQSVWRLLGLGRPSNRRGVAVATAAVVLVTAPALAITQPWNPQPRQIIAKPGATPADGVPTANVSVSSASPPAAELSLLAVLRRPAGTIDQSTQVSTALRQLFGGVSGIETHYVRVLYDVPGEPLVVLFPAQRWASPPGPDGVSGYQRLDPICVEVVPVASQGSSGNCLAASDVAAGHLTGSDGEFEYSVVPDGVASVVLRFADGSERHLAVANNFVAFDASPASPGGPPAFPVSTTWLDSSGNPVTHH
jgi:hypothetical protein